MFAQRSNLHIKMVTIQIFYITLTQRLHIHRLKLFISQHRPEVFCVLQPCAAGRSPTPPAWCCLPIGPRPTTRGRTASGASTWKRTRGSCSTSKCKRLHSGCKTRSCTERSDRRSDWPRDVKHFHLLTRKHKTHSRVSFSYFLSLAQTHHYTRTQGRVSAVALTN